MCYPMCAMCLCGSIIPILLRSTNAINDSTQFITIPLKDEANPQLVPDYTQFLGHFSADRFGRDAVPVYQHSLLAVL